MEILVALLLAAATVVGCGSDTSSTSSDDDTGPDAFSGYVRTPAQEVGDITLPGSDGTPVNMAGPAGGLRIVYFGYTSCPDVCPTTMTDLKRALAGLTPEQRSKVAVDMVTIDPDRDVPAKLAEYVTTFIPDAGAISTPDQALLRSATGAFGANFSVEPGPDGDPEVTHTADLYAVDDTGQVVLAWPFGTTSKDIGRDISRLLDGERPPSETSTTTGS